MNSQWSKEEDWPTFESGCLVDADSSAGVFAVYKEKPNNIKNSNPLFVDEANLNLALRPDSPAFAIPGFQPIPFGQIGPRTINMFAIDKFQSRNMSHASCKLSLRS